MKTTPKRSASAGQKVTDERPTTEDRMVILVRRGALRRFDALKQKTTELPVIISWDRRQAERRRTTTAGTAERRGADRRQTAPFTWELADFVVVPGTTSVPAEAIPGPGSRRPATPHATTRAVASAPKPKLKAVKRKSARARQARTRQS